MAISFDEHLDQVERALKSIGKIENNPELQNRAFDELFGTPATRKNAAPSTDPVPEVSEEEAGAKKPGPKKQRKVASVAQDKNLDIAPTGKTSWADFIAEKKPGSLHEKYTCCVYWLLEVAGLPTASINQIVTLFIAAKWTLPPNPRNQASQTSRAGFIDSGDQSKLKLTSPGSALVLNDLPPK